MRQDGVREILYYNLAASRATGENRVTVVSVVGI